MNSAIRLTHACAIAIALLALPAASHAQAMGGMAMGDKMADKMGDKMAMSAMQVQQLMADWPAASREAVAFMTAKYGAPAAMTPEMAVWGRTGPWKRTVVYRAEHAHDFPAHHTDVMQQWVDYKAPAAMYDDLAAYDGSVVVERTSGEISARCDREGANMLALNLADEIVHGKRTVASARTAYGEQITALKAGKTAPYTERLMFGAMSDTGDADKPVAMTAMSSSSMMSHP